MERMPVFVKIDDYDDVLAMVRTIRSKMEDAKGTLQKIHDLKNEEDHQVDSWQSTLTEVEKKIDFIDHSLNEPEHI
ncbi:hypothetical protein CL620_04130 [archaeon]|nr:hypothetical protein [archaeon]|tara:strand:+ start:153 stop:380 length:228 start_codon:yes stop_codon:yes gene_type:complete